MLQSATFHKAALDDLVTVGTASAQRMWRQGDPRRLARISALLQVRAAQDAQRAVAVSVAEQHMDAPAVAQISPRAFAGASDGRTLDGLYAEASSSSALERMISTQIADASRSAGLVAIAARPAVGGYIRDVGGTCCSRCAVLAGRFYRWNDGFLRHTNCKCINVPASSGAYITTPATLLAEGRITDLSIADTQALDAGADLGQVVNVRRSAAGMTRMGEVVARVDRPTPAGILQVATDRGDAIHLLTKYGYLTS